MNFAQLLGLCRVTSKHEQLESKIGREKILKLERMGVGGADEYLRRHAPSDNKAFRVRLAS